MGLRSLAVVSALIAVLPLAASATLTSTNPPASRGGPNGLAILRPCASTVLKAVVTSDQHATLHRELRITLTNVGASACAIYGYPAVRLLDELKHPRITAESFSQTPRQFIIAPDGQAAFRLRVATGNGSISYVTAATLAIIPPGDVTPLLLNVELPVAPTIEITALQPAAELK